MGVKEELINQSLGKDSALTIGIFDGVHLGHRYLLSKLVALAKEQNLASLVVTFREHPEQVIAPQRKIFLLSDLEERVELLKKEGVDGVVVLPFTQELAELGAREFLSLLKECLLMRGLVVGPDSTIGRNREADVSQMEKLGKEMGFSVTVVPPLKVEGEVVSSTAIRSALFRGDVEKAAKLIGHPFSVEGEVVKGVGRGVKLGFPTANLEIKPEQALPQDGVYVTWAHIDSESYKSVTSIGKRPTFGANERAVEVHLLDYKGDLYGQNLKVTFLKRLREERQFDSAESLKKQIIEDIKEGRALFSRQG